MRKGKVKKRHDKIVAKEKQLNEKLIKNLKSQKETWLPFAVLLSLVVFSQVLGIPWMR